MLEISHSTLSDEAEPSRVVHDHVIVLDAGALVVLGHAAERVEEETVTELHDVRLVDAGDFLHTRVGLGDSAPAGETRYTHLAVVLERKVEREANNALRLGTRGDLQALDNTGETLVLKTRVFTLGVLTDNGKIDIAVTSRETRERLAKNDGGVDV